QGQTRMVPEVAYDKHAKKLVETRKVPLNPNGVSIWRNGAKCPFPTNNETWFTERSGQTLELERDFMQPFFHRVARAVRDIRNDWLIFAEVSPSAPSPVSPTTCPNARSMRATGTISR